mmetsp:Transcript_148981/g.263435  ORF Transcript_148981/g.263435 Transcript_148981/m.263435 type:complete len:869 (+) Transcript_148981:62-2668(+)
MHHSLTHALPAGSPQKGANGVAHPAHMEQAQISEEDPAYVKALQVLEDLQAPSRDKTVKETGVAQKIYLGFIKKELDNEDACLQLPMTILLLISFSALAIMSLGQEKIYAVEEAIEFDIHENANFAFAHYFGHKGMIDVNSYADFWSWIRLGYLPLIIAQSWPYSEPYPGALGDSVMKGTNYNQGALPSKWKFPGYTKPAPVMNDYMRYHRIIGGIRMQQEVVPADYEQCIVPTSFLRSTIEGWLGKPCMHSGLAELPPELHETEVFDNMKRTQWLLPELDSFDKLTATLLDMEDGCNLVAATGRPISECRCTWCKEQNPRQPWIDEQTRRVEAAFVVFNPVYGLYTYVGCNFFFNRGGHIHKFINCMSVWADPQASPLGEQIPAWIMNVLWLGAITYVVVVEVKDIINLIRNANTRWYKTIWNEYVGLWNTVDWISILVALIVVGGYIRLQFLLADVNAQLVEMIKFSTTPNPERNAYEKGVAEFFSNFEPMTLQEKDFRRSLSVYPMIVMLRLFKSFSAQPKLALVTATMEKAAQDFLHFFIVFASVSVCMLVNAMLFFGQDVEDFASFPRALHSCFMAMFGGWDWGLMREIGFLKAGIWFWIFVLVMVSVLLNMLLAIVMEAYTEVKEKAKNAETLIKQMKEMRRRRQMFLRGERVKLNQVYDAFLDDAGGNEKAMLHEDRLLTPDVVCKKVAKIQLDQATRTLKSAVKWDEVQNEEILDDDAIKDGIRDTLGNIQARTRIMFSEVNNVRDKLTYYHRLQVPGDAEFEYHFGGRSEHYTQDIHGNLVGVVTHASSDIGSLFVDNMAKIEDWQESLETHQDELHGLITEMQIMVTQQARCIDSMKDAMPLLEGPRANQMDGDPIME